MNRLRACTAADLDTILAVVNDAAQAYRGVIPADRWHEPYMPRIELEAEIAAGVRFWGWEEGGELAGVMGLQHRGEVDLIRHAYVRTRDRRRGIGARLLAHIESLSARPILIGTWAAAAWAIRFYETHGYRVLARGEAERLLRRYWSVPERQIATSIVLASARWEAK